MVCPPVTTPSPPGVCTTVRLVAGLGQAGVQLETLTPDEYHGQASDRRQGLTCAHKQPQGFACGCQHALLWLSHLPQGVHSAVWYWASVQSHASAQLEVQPQVHAQWWGSATGVKAGQTHVLAPSQGPELAASAAGGVLGSADVGGGVGEGEQEGLSWH